MSLSSRLWKIFNGLQSWPIWPESIRTRFLAMAGVRIDPSARLADKVFVGGRSVSLGRQVYLNVGGYLDGSAPITIGDFSRLGPLVRILTGTHEYRLSEVRLWPEDPCVAKPVTIMRGCWLGMGVMVMPGVTIREGCIIAAGAVVVADTAPHGLYAGMPAKRIKDLPVEEQYID